MTRDELLSLVEEIQEETKRLFQSKNRSYGRNDDVFHNFRESARRFFHRDDPQTMYLILGILEDKHNIALASHGLADIEAEQRIKDKIVYDYIALALYNEYRKACSQETNMLQ